MTEFIAVTALVYLAGAFFVYRQMRQDASDRSESFLVSIRWPLLILEWIRAPRGR